LRAEADEANEKAETAAAERDVLKSRLRAAEEGERASPELAREIEELRSLLSERDEEIRATASTLRESEAALEERADELRRSREKENALSVALSDAEAQLVESRKNVDLIVARADTASQIFTENAAALRLADARAATAELEVNVAEERVKTLEENLDAIAAERDELQRELDAQKQQQHQLRPISPVVASSPSAAVSASPSKPAASIDVIEALEHERRARALFQSDARYWRERYEAIAATSSAVLTPLSAFAPQTARRPNTPGIALALAAGLPPSPVVLDADVEDVDEERPDAENAENEPIPRAKAKPTTSIDSPAPPTRARRSLTAYFQ
jgi:hypothetical protein